MGAKQKGLHIVVLLLLCYTTRAQQIDLPPLYMISSDTATEQALGAEHYQILEDKDGKWRIEDVSTPPVSTKFRFSDIQQKGTSLRGIYWIRYRLKSLINHPATFL